MDRTILRSQKNQVLMKIREIGLDPFNFFWSSYSSSRSYLTGAKGGYDDVSIVRYKGSNYFFLFDFVNGQHYAEYSPGDEVMVFKEATRLWVHQLAHVRMWLSCLSREIAEPDMWEAVSKYQIRGAAISSDTNNEPFSYFQIEQVHKGLDDIYGYLKEYAIRTSEQDVFVKERLAYLSDATKRFGKKDWLNMCVGSLVTIAVSLALEPSKANAIWQIMKSAISSFIRFLP